MLAYPLFAIGLFFLVYGGDWLVKGSVGLAERLSIPPLIIGLTIVAFGTSAPELVISLNAALGGAGGLAVGNVVGSNIANVLLVLGAPALITPIIFADHGVKRSLIFLVITTVIFMGMLATGTLGRLFGLVLLVMLASFLYMQYRDAMSQKAADAAAAAEDDYLDEVGEVPTETRTIVIYILMGLIALPLAAHVTVSAATDIALQWGVSEAVIGLTIVAIGTSLPELATGISAARQGNASVGVGNVIGSNLFNIAAIMGITATVIPVGVAAHIINFDMWVMFVATLFLIALPLLNIKIDKGMGALLLGFFSVYILATVLIT
ncbi:calcium/sodium antiporter [Pseudahrensia aquimaris]|uniref:Calcium/sodium antiporter n=1 Tax=Pseudahrensia aquimaris TaxID=744461 RepID=A0ABW3FB53_9HYPH